MLIPTSVLWDLGYLLYIYGSIFIIILTIWQVKESYHGLTEHKRSFCPTHSVTLYSTYLSQSLEIMPYGCYVSLPSQDWLPQEGSVRQLLCEDPCCQTCNGMALEIQQVLPDSGFRNKMKSFLHCINLKTKGKGHKESTSSTSEKMANTRKVNVTKSLAPAKSPKERTKTEKTRGDLKAQFPPPEKQMGLVFTDIPRSLDTVTSDKSTGLLKKTHRNQKTSWSTQCLHPLKRILL
uniref:SPATA31-like domain-containing protein n=1 Tax=Bos indicus x Bos taurus TaxID=30522 RepID=A0A4W2GS81_BOBOX